MDPKAFSHFGLPEPLQIHPLAGGANNRVYKLEFSGRNPLVYKEYFQHPNDLRPRLKSEFSFLKYAWEIGLRNIPEPLSYNESLNSALYTYLHGRHIHPQDVHDSLIDQKAAFFLSLNSQKHKAPDLPPASEACFTIESYLQITQTRIDRIASAHTDSPLNQTLRSFIDSFLLPKWQSIQQSVCKTALHHDPLPQSERCISPSDFGFHNALLSPNNTLQFIDFEYAGWDDPCKAICDLFCQPRIPIPERYFPSLSASIASTSSNPEKCLARFSLIWPVMQIKWCCILLNSFTHVGKHRRQFSQSEELERQENQLRMAKEQLKKIEI